MKEEIKKILSLINSYNLNNGQWNIIEHERDVTYEYLLGHDNTTSQSVVYPCIYVCRDAVDDMSENDMEYMYNNADRIFVRILIYYI